MASKSFWFMYASRHDDTATVITEIENEKKLEFREKKM